MVATYDSLGVEITYPENWLITDEDLEQWPRTVSIQSPEGSFWSLFLYPGDSSADEVTKEVLEAMRLDYEQLESFPVNEKIGAENAIGYDVDFYCMNMIVHAQIRCFPLNDQLCLLIYQAEDRDFPKHDAVFRAMTVGMLQSCQQRRADK